MTGRTEGSSAAPTDSEDRARASASRGQLAIEAIVAIESPQDFRLHPRDRLVAFTAELAGARQLCTLPLDGGTPTQITASAEPVSDPQWSPDGQRLAFVRKTAVWVVELDGSRLVKAVDHPSGCTMPRWSPDGGRLAFLSRRRGWSQVWIVDAPKPQPGGDEPNAPEPQAVTPTAIDVRVFAWSPDGKRLIFDAQRRPSDLETNQLSIVDLATGVDEVVAGEGSFATAAHWLPDGGLMYASNEDGWFQIVRRSPDGGREVLTSGQREHAEPTGGLGCPVEPSPDASRFAHVEIQDGLVDLLIGPIAGGRDGGGAINPWPGVWRLVGWLPDSAWIAAVGESATHPRDLWLLPVPGIAPAGARARRVTDSLPSVVRAAMSAASAPVAERLEIEARDGLRVAVTLWRPPVVDDNGSDIRVPLVVVAHGGPTWQSYRGWNPFKQLLIREGFAILDVDFRGSTGYGRDFWQANRGEWGHGDVHDLIDAGRWAAEQPWCDGRLAIYGGSYGGYMVLCALVEEPSMWRAGVDLYGDSEIAESYRHGDRRGRLDLLLMMGSPEDPTNAEAYRRGSPVYRAERIEAPLLLLHGRRDKRVVPLMTERMVEALEIEGKYHEVHWYDEEAHGWERRENRRDAFERTLTFLRRHVLDQPSAE